MKGILNHNKKKMNHNQKELLDLAKNLTKSVEEAVKSYESIQHKTLGFLEAFVDSGSISSEDLDDLKNRLKTAKTQEEIDSISKDFENKIKL